jgi:hypothetical protein
MWEYLLSCGHALQGDSPWIDVDFVRGATTHHRRNLAPARTHPPHGISSVAKSSSYSPSRMAGCILFPVLFPSFGRQTFGTCGYVLFSVLSTLFVSSLALLLWRAPHGPLTLSFAASDAALFDRLLRIGGSEEAPRDSAYDGVFVIEILLPCILALFAALYFASAAQSNSSDEESKPGDDVDEEIDELTEEQATEAANEPEDAVGTESEDDISEDNRRPRTPTGRRLSNPGAGQRGHSADANFGSRLAYETRGELAPSSARSRRRAAVERGHRTETSPSVRWSDADAMSVDIVGWRDGERSAEMQRAQRDECLQVPVTLPHAISCSALAPLLPFRRS